MDIPVFYFDANHAIGIHDWIIEQSGGLAGVYPDGFGKIESTLEHIQNDTYYPSFEDKLTHLVYSINKSHAFCDGNKRSSLALGAYFLELNGYDYCLKNLCLRWKTSWFGLQKAKYPKNYYTN